MSTVHCIVKNVYTEIQASDTVSYEIAEALAVKTKRFWFSRPYRRGVWDGKTREFYKWRHRRLPTGLLGYASLKLMKLGYTLTYTDARTHRPDCTPRPLALVPHDFQQTAFETIVGNTFMDTGLAWPRGVVQIATSGGKTVLMAQCAAAVDGNVLILVHTRDLLWQHRKELTRLMDEPVGVIGDGACDPRRVTVATVQTLSEMTEQFLPLLLKAQSLFVDEAHHLSSAQFLRIAKLCPAYVRLGFSATAFKDRDDPQHNLRVIGATGDLLFHHGQQALVAGGHAAPVTVHFAEVKEPTTVQIGGGVTVPSNALDYRGAYETLIVQNETRNQMIARWVGTGPGPTLVLVVRIPHGQRLATLLGCPFLSGKESSTERAKALAALGEGRVPAVVATTIFDEGVNAPEIRRLVLAGGGKAATQFYQRIGRGMRLKSDGSGLDVLDFLDGTHARLLQHSQRRITLAARAGFTVRLADVAGAAAAAVA